MSVKETGGGSVRSAAQTRAGANYSRALPNVYQEPLTVWHSHLRPHSIAKLPTIDTACSEDYHVTASKEIKRLWVGTMWTVTASG